MTRQTTLLLAATMVVLLIWLLAGCAGDRSEDRSQQQQARQSEESASGMSTRPTKSTKLVENLNGTMVFQLNDDSYSTEIYTMNADGSDLSWLTDLPEDEEAVEGNATWSPDLEKIAFTMLVEEEAASASASARSGIQEVPYIFVMNTAGSDQRQLLDSTARAPAWSPDGKEIAFSAGGDDGYSYNIYVMNADGSGERRKITPTVDYGTGAIDPTWSPDGKKIAFTRGDPVTFGSPSHVYKMDADGSKETRLTYFAQGKELWPTWSPDGENIALVRTGYPGGAADLESSAIFVMDSDGSDPALIKEFFSETLSHPDWRASQNEERIEPASEEEEESTEEVIEEQRALDAALRSGGFKDTSTR
jgi:TolB protein